MAQLHKPTEKEVVVLVGPPGCGKSTYASAFPNHLVVSTDNYLNLWATQSGKTYDEVWEERFKDSEKIMWTTAIAYMREGAAIIWDQTNLGIKKRKNILRNIPKGYYKRCVCWEIPTEELQARLKKREEEVPGKTISWKHIQNMLNNYVRPELSEGFDSVEVRRK